MPYAKNSLLGLKNCLGNIPFRQHNQPPNHELSGYKVYETLFASRLLRHLTPPIIPNGATSNNRFAAAVPADIAPAELHPPPDVAAGAGVAVTTIIDGVCVGCGGSGVAVTTITTGAGVGGAGVSLGMGVAVGMGV